MTDPMAKLRRKHNTRHKLVHSANFPGEKWHIAQWRSNSRTWQNIIVNATLEDALTALKEVGAITGPT